MTSVTSSRAGLRWFHAIDILDHRKQLSHAFSSEREKFITTTVIGLTVFLPFAIGKPHKS